MYKKILLTFLFICYFNVAHATSQANIAIIDLKYVLKNAIAAEHALNRLNLEKEQYQKEIEKQNKLLEQQYNDINKQATVLSESVLKNKQKELMSNISKLEKNVKNKQTKLQSDYLKTLSIIEKEIITIVNEIAQEQRYDMVITKDNLLYSDPKFNISAKVVKLLNKKLPKIQLSDIKTQ